MILSLKSIKRSKQDLLTFALGHPYIDPVIVAFRCFPVLKNKISVKPTSLSGDHTTDDFKE